MELLPKHPLKMVYLLFFWIKRKRENQKKLRLNISLSGVSLVRGGCKKSPFFDF